MNESTLAAAQEHGRSGRWVFPLAPRTKIPAIATERGGHGFYDASTNPSVLQALWELGGYPDASIGCRTGRRTGIVVIEDDPRHGGDTSLVALERRYGPLPEETYMVRSGGGGTHRHFTYPLEVAYIKSVANCFGAEYAGVDVKADGGLVVLPPSIHKNGTSYTLLRDAPLAALPEEWIEALRASNAKLARLPWHASPSADAVAVDTLDANADGAYWLAWALDKETDGASDAYGYRLAQQVLVNHVANPERWLAQYADAATHNPADPFTERDIARWMDSASDSDIVRFGTPAPARTIRPKLNGHQSPPTAAADHASQQEAHTFAEGLQTQGTADCKTMQNNGEPGAEHAKCYGPGVKRLSEVEERKYRWLWHPYFVRNKANVMEGDPGVGKSLLIALLTAKETRGELMKYDTRPGWALGHPDADDQEHDPGGTVLLLAGEDDTEDTLKPRIQAAGGIAERVLVVEKLPLVVTDKHGNEVTRYRRPRLPSDTDAILRIVREEPCRLVIVDPITSFLDKDVSPNSDTEMRSALDPLVDGCAALNCTPLFTRHLNKGTGQSALHRGAGTMGIAGLARSVVMVADDPDAPDGVEQHVLGHVKSNIARKGATLVFQKFVPMHQPDAMPTIDWQGTSTRKPNDVYRLLTAKMAGQSGDERSERLGRQMSERLRKAVEWLRGQFAERPGEGLPGSAIIAQGQADNGFSEDAIRKAAAYLGVEFRRDGYQAPVYWYYSGENDDA